MSFMSVKNGGIRPCRVPFSKDVRQMLQRGVKLGGPFHLRKKKKKKVTEEVSKIYLFVCSMEKKIHVSSGKGRKF